MNSSQEQTMRSPTVVVIGAGMTGILVTIKLREAGIEDVVLLEKAENLGGTWRENTYPGVACDVPAHMYSYSFEPNPEWSRRFAGGEEIQAYFERVARKYGVTPAIRFNEAVTSNTYAHGKWTVGTSKGNTFVADFVINCTGILHHPVLPAIEGIESFAGKLFHTARWDHELDLAGKRVGIIGTGSTAAQVIPQLAPEVGHLTIFQRTPQWILPIGNKLFPEKLRRKLRENPNRLRRLVSAYQWAFQNLLTKAVTGHKVQNFFFSQVCKLNLRLSVRDRALREKLRPDYRVGCKRIVVNTDFYPAVQRPNVALETCGISKIVPQGVVTTDGQLHELDVLVAATGFNPTAYMRPMAMRGKDGLEIDAAWEHKIRTYRSLCMPGFPNNFLMLGPNTPIGNYSVIAMSEVQCDYILQLIERWRRREYDELDVSESAVTAFGKHIKAGMGKTVWVGGCRSWYLDADGDPILWPYTWQQWVDEMAVPVMSDFQTASFGDDSEAGVAA